MTNPLDALSISFDNGLGSLGNAWNVDTSVAGQVTLRGPAALMEWAVGRDSGHGYGTYTIDAKLEGNNPGPAIVFWPGDNQWPGQEIDLAEILPGNSGKQYGTLHWNDKGDAYYGQIYEGLAQNQWHQYQMEWAPNSLTFRVDGKQVAHWTDHVPTDFAHGGMNNTIGFLNTSSNTAITVGHVDYQPLGGNGGGVVNNLVQTVTDTVHGLVEPLKADGSVDWDSLAATVTANWLATGTWHL